MTASKARKGNRWAGVEKRGPGRWRARVRGPDGRERSKTFEREEDARRLLDSQRNSRTHRGEWIDPGFARNPFGEYVGPLAGDEVVPDVLDDRQHS